MAEIIEKTEERSSELVRHFDDKKDGPPSPTKGILSGIIILIILVAGTLTGYYLSGQTKGSTVVSDGLTVKAGQEIGSSDTKSYPDNAVGVLEKGGLDGEGTHKLIRDGGPSQTAYLTSSVIDLDTFEGKRVQVWGNTIKGQKASWLMDVGRIKIFD